MAVGSSRITVCSIYCLECIGLIFLEYKFSKNEIGQSRFFSLKRVFLLILFSSAYFLGAFHGSKEPVEMPHLEGRELRVLAQVEGVYVRQNWSLVNLEVKGIWMGGHFKTCNITASWTPIRMNHSISVNRELELQGVFVNARPGKSDTPFMLWLQPEYGFQGYIHKREWVSTSQKPQKWGIAWLQSTIHEAIFQACPPNEKQYGALVESIVFGNGQVLKNVHQVFLQAGVLHVLVASGANLLLVSHVLKSVLRWALPKGFYGKLMQTMILTCSLWLYAAISGMNPSVIRAALMSNYRLLGNQFDRKPSTMTSLLFAGFSMAIWSPASLFSVSAILSFIATFAVDRAVQHSLKWHKMRTIHLQNVQLNTIFLQVWRVFLYKLWMTIKISFFVEMVSAPLILVLFGQWTPYAIISNLLIEPILFVLLPESVIWIVLVIVSDHFSLLQPISQWVGQSLFLVCAGFYQTLKWIAERPDALLYFPPPPVWLLFLYYFCLSSIPYFMRLFRRKFQVGFSLDGSEDI